VPSPVAPPAAAREVVPVVFRFDVGDELATGVWTEPELSSQQRLLADGTISPPLLKPQRVVGLTVEEVQAKLTLAYKEYLKEPKVSVRVVTIHGDRVFVLGEVRTPQTVSLVGPISVVQAIAAAGGFAEEFADKSRVQVLRVNDCGKPAPVVVDAEAVLRGKARDVPLQRGDVVFVPARGVTEFARTVGQALSPITSAIGSASSVGALIIAGQNVGN
jgi:polysaccharide export outer membrane protein